MFSFRFTPGIVGCPGPGGRGVLRRVISMDVPCDFGVEGEVRQMASNGAVKGVTPTSVCIEALG